MANIGRVYKDSYVKNKQTFPLLVLDIRTITVRKKFTISVNIQKYPDGKITGSIAQGKEDYPDYHIWYNMSNRGESLPSVIVGNIKNAVSDNGLAYKKALIFDPFISKHNIYFTLFSVDADKKIDKDHLYNVVAQPYRNMNPTNNTQAAQTPHPSYGENTQQTPQSYNTANDAHEDIPSVDVDEDEIPF